MEPRTGAQIHEKIRCVNSIFIVFHYDNGIAEITKMLQGLYELVIIALVEPDSGLVEYIQCAHKPRTEL